ncbi:LysR substrate-binding domain-containing protein [Phenylobacterium haematophilum]|uniref:LysR substrate-binding domain-containing protein n=1 Tax=Phenylobacterium haematophilum TaxID=98513 RepID=UPI003CCDE57F
MERELHVSCVGTLAMRWLIPRLPAFHARHPGLSIRVNEAYGHSLGTPCCALRLCADPRVLSIRDAKGRRSAGDRRVPRVVAGGSRRRAASDAPDSARPTARLGLIRPLKLRNAIPDGLRGWGLCI